VTRWANADGGRDIAAAGGVLWRPATGDGLTPGTPAAAGIPAAGAAVEVAIVHRQRYDDWSLPKGKLHAGEHPLLAACREVREEAGVEPVVGRRLPQQEYRLGPDRKTVDYWTMSPRDIAATTMFAPNDEVDQVRWVRPADAATWLTYDRDRQLLRAFLAVPPDAAMLLLVRHARAGHRDGWPGEDRLRPLDGAGRRQAEGLRAALRYFQPDRVLAADNVRCVETVEPLAEELGVPVATEPALTEQAFGVDVGRGLRRVQEIVALGGRSVLCSQGGVIPPIITAMSRQDGLPLPEISARKGSVWALSFVDDRLAAADYYPDLADRGTHTTGPGGRTR
jgi:8-oxo-dGTP diphosphatase